MTERKYLPTLAELIDRLAIVQLKAIFIPEHKDAYVAERELILHDIDLMLADPSLGKMTAKDVHAIMVIMLSNRYIWENESRARLGGSEQDKLLKLTHSVNGVRNTAKNIVAAYSAGRKDHKIDCLASDLEPQFGNWNIFS